MGFNWKGLVSTAASTFGGPIGGAIAGGFLGGGSSAPGKFERYADLAQRDAHAKELEAQMASGDNSTSVAPKQSIEEQAGQQIGQFGKDLATEFTDVFKNRFIQNKVDNMFAPKEKPPWQRGLEQKAYQDQIHPGTNPWERLGSSGGASAQGGLAGAAEQRSSARDVAGITSNPALKRANLEFQQTPSKIELNETGATRNKAASTKMGVETQHEETKIPQTIAQTEQTKEQTKWIPTLSNAKASLDAAQTFKAGSEDLKAQAQAKKVLQETITEVQKSGIAKSNKVIQKFIADHIEWIKGAAIAGGGATVALAIGKFIKLLRNVNKVPITGVTSNPSKGKIINWPKYGPKAGQVLE